MEPSDDHNFPPSVGGGTTEPNDPSVETPGTAGQSASFDWTELPTQLKELKPTIGPTYDPRPQEDAARRIIAYTLIWLLIVSVVAILTMVWTKAIQVAEIKEFSIILGPIVTLVSAATGFYYGTKSK